MKDKDENKNVFSVFLTEFIRLSDVIKWSAISFIGFLLGVTTTSLWEYTIPFFVFLITTFCIMSFTFSINNYFDVDSDRKNPRLAEKNAIASEKISKKLAIICMCLFVLISSILSFLYQFQVFLASSIMLFWMWIYSAPPFRLKGRPIIDVIWHFFAFFGIVLWGSIIAGPLQLINWITAISLGAFSCIGQVWNHIVDYAFDKESGTSTFAVKLGLDKANITIKGLIVAHIILLVPLVTLYTLSYFIALFVLVSIILVGLIALRPKKDGFPTKRSFEYFFAVVVGGAVYVSILIYHFCVIYGVNCLKTGFTIF